MSGRGIGVPMRSGSVTCAVTRTDGTTTYYGDISPVVMRMDTERHMNAIAVLEGVVRNNESHVFYPLLNALKCVARMGIEPMIFIGLQCDSACTPVVSTNIYNQTG